MADKYKQSLRSIEKQEFAVEKLQNKLKEISNSDKTPSTVKNLVGETEKAEKELAKLKQQIDSLYSKQDINKKEITKQKRIIASNEDDNTVDSRVNISNAETKIQVLTKENSDMELQLDGIREKYDLLEAKIYDNKNAISSAKEELRTTSTDALNKQLGLANQKLEDAKEKAIKLKEEFDNSKKIKFASFFGGGIDEVGKKIDKFKNKMSRLIGTAMIFSLIRNQLTSLRNGFISLLKTDDQFSSSLNQVKANLMTAFAPIYNACLPAINSLMNSLSKVTGTIAVFMANLFGTNIKDATKDAQKLSGALNKTASSAKKASGALGSFDTLEVLPDDSSGGGTSGANSNSIDYSGELTYSQGLLDVMNSIADFIKNNKEIILGTLAGILTFITLIKLDLGGLKSLGIGLIIAGIVTLVQGIVNFIKDPSWENFAVILQGLALILAGVAVAMLAVNAANPVAWIILAIALITGLASIIIKYWNKICKIGSTVGEWFYTTIIEPIVSFVTNLWDDIVKFFETAINWIKDNWQGLILFIINPVAGVFKLLYDNCEGFRNIVDNVVSSVKDFFSDLWNNMKNGAADAWNGIKSVFSSVASFFKNIFTNAWTAVKNVFSSGGKIFTGIKEGIFNSFKSVVNVLIDGINKIVSIPFKGINSALGRLRNLEILGVEPFKWIPTINVPKIPKLARGAVIPPRQEFAAILGDQKHGTNIEAPLETIKQANREVLEEVLGRIGLNNEEKEIVLKNWQFVLQFGNTTLGKMVIEEIKKYQKETNIQFLLA